MSTYFVTRHHGALDWARRRGIDATMTAHLDTGAVQPGDVVIGTLPVHLAAEVCARGGRYWHLAMETPPEVRGTDLTADDMDRFGARLVEYKIGTFVASVKTREVIMNLLSLCRAFSIQVSSRYRSLSYRHPRVSALSTLLLFTCSASWIADSLYALASGDWQSQGWLWLTAAAVGSAVFFIVTALGLYSLRHKLLSTPAEEFAADEKFGRLVLVMGLSKLSPAGWTALAEAKKRDFETLRLPRRYLAKDVQDAMKGFNWQQNLRAIWPHRSSIKRLIVVTSPESQEEFGEFKKLVYDLMLNCGRKDFRCDMIEKADPSVSFLEYKKIVEILGNIVFQQTQDRSLKSTDICIDVTAGTKIFSIAAAITTLNQGLLGSYVTDQEGDVRMFDARVELSDAISS